MNVPGSDGSEPYFGPGRDPFIPVKHRMPLRCRVFGHRLRDPHLSGVSTCWRCGRRFQWRFLIR